MRGRFAPSPTGQLHLGNLRTALLAWLFARSSGGGFILRFEDLDTASVRTRFYEQQRRALQMLGLDWDDEVRQQDHPERYRDAIATLRATGTTYDCYCSRREIREAASAPHGSVPDGSYPGTCRSLTAAARRAKEAEGRPAALRLRAPDVSPSFVDGVHGSQRGHVDDFVVMRGDGVPAYNLAVVVDDHLSGIQEVVRGDDLLDSTPRQLHVAHLLGIVPPAHAHVPLVLGPSGARLAKRDGAVTLDDRVTLGETPAEVRTMLARSCGLAGVLPTDTANDLISRFDRAALRTEAWVFDGSDLSQRREGAAPTSAPERRDRRGHRPG